MDSIDKFKFLLLGLFFCSTFIYAVDTFENQAAPEKTIKVDSIAIIGNKITKDDIILRELNFSPGDYVNDDILSYNRERIYSLSLFTSVKVYSLRSNTQNIVYIEVEESWYIWPIPFVYKNDDSFKKLSYGMSLLYKNFRGRNESLSANVSLGYNPGYSLLYYNPYIDRKRNISFSGGTSYLSSNNISTLAELEYGKDFKYRIITGWLQLGKRLNLFNDVYLLLGYDYVEAPDSSSGRITASGNRIDNTFKIGLTYSFDTRNLKQFPDSGIYAGIDYSQKGLGIDNINYSILKFDFRHYFKVIGKLTAKWRAAARFTLGNINKIPFYDLSFLGYGERVRGHFNDYREGHNLYIGSLEFKYPVIQEWDIDFKLPLLPKELTSYRVAVYPNIFFDAGAVQFREGNITIKNRRYLLKNNKLSLKSFDTGYGAGLIFLILPYNIFRLEVAFDERSKAEYNIGFGFSF